MPRKTVAAAKFTELWQRAENVKEVVKQTGLSASYCIQRATGLRKLGVPLKKMAVPKVPRLDIDELIAIAQKTVPDTISEPCPEPASV